MKKNLWVESDFINSRLDRWIRKNICEIPQSLIEKSIRKGNVKINNKKKKSSYKLQKNDQVFINNFHLTLSIKNKGKEKYKATKKE